MKFIFAAIYAVAAVAVSAQDAGPVYITSPLTGTVYTAGKPAVINWINPASDVITKIILAQGISTNIQPLITIAENVDTKLGTYSWDVPSDISPGTDYAFVLGVSPNVSYTGQFTIKNDNAAPVSSGAASVSSAASGAASSAAAAPSATSSSVASSSAAVTPAAAPAVTSPSAAASSIAAPSGSSKSAHASASTTPTASSSTSASNSNKVAFGAVAAAGIAVMALI